jgi:hypothetical protein
MATWGSLLSIASCGMSAAPWPADASACNVALSSERNTTEGSIPLSAEVLLDPPLVGAAAEPDQVEPGEVFQSGSAALGK